MSVEKEGVIRLRVMWNVSKSLIQREYNVELNNWCYGDGREDSQFVLKTPSGDIMFSVRLRGFFLDFEARREEFDREFTEMMGWFLGFKNSHNIDYRHYLDLKFEKATDARFLLLHEADYWLQLSESHFVYLG